MQLERQSFGFAPIDLVPFLRQIVLRFRHIYFYWILHLWNYRVSVSISSPLQRGIRF